MTRRSSVRYQLLGELKTGDVTLTISNITENDSGIYGCRVQYAGWFNDEKYHVSLTIEKGKERTTCQDIAWCLSDENCEPTKEYYDFTAFILVQAEQLVFFYCLISAPVPTTSQTSANVTITAQTMDNHNHGMEHSLQNNMMSVHRSLILYCFLLQYYSYTWKQHTFTSSLCRSCDHNIYWVFIHARLQQIRIGKLDNILQFLQRYETLLWDAVLTDMNLWCLQETRGHDLAVILVSILLVLTGVGIVSVLVMSKYTPSIPLPV